MRSLKKYVVLWEESHSAVVYAKNEKEAEEMILDSKQSPENESAEISSSPEAKEWII